MSAYNDYVRSVHKSSINIRLLYEMYIGDSYDIPYLDMAIKLLNNIDRSNFYTIVGVSIHKNNFEWRIVDDLGVNSLESIYDEIVKLLRLRKINSIIKEI